MGRRRGATSMAAMPTAIVTGASRGLGLALAHALADRGWRLVVDARDGVALEEAVAPLRTAPRSSRRRRRRRRWHRRAWSPPPARASTCSSTTPRTSAPPRSPPRTLPLDELEQVLRINVLAPLALVQTPCPSSPTGARIVNVTSDAAVEPYEGWGGYGASKAALEQSAVFAAEHPGLRVYAVDPGDMNTRMHQDAFPGEDISDRPPPEASVPGLLALIEGDLPSGRYAARPPRGAPA